MDKLQTLFQSFCNFGAGQRGAFQMNNASFAKFCKDTKVIDKKFTTTDADLLFSKIKPKGGRTISFDCFRYQGLPEIAVKRGLTTNDLVTKMLHQGTGPTSNATEADAVRFHDDKSQYTGVYKKGGPTNVDLATSDLSHITNRNEADVRGSNIVTEKKIPQRDKPAYQASKPAPLDGEQVQQGPADAPPQEMPAPTPAPATSSSAPTPSPATTAPAPTSAPATAGPTTTAPTSTTPTAVPPAGAAPPPAAAPLPNDVPPPATSIEPATSTPTARTPSHSERPTSQQMARAQMVIGGTGLGGSSANVSTGPVSDPDSPSKGPARYGRRSVDAGPPSPAGTRAVRSNSGQRGSRSGSIGFRSGASPKVSVAPSSGTPSASPKASVASSSSTPAPSATPTPTAGGKGLFDVFEQYLAFGGGQHGKSEMDNARFAKFCKDAKLIDKHFTSTDADLLFSKIKPKRGRTISFDVWKNFALPEIARKKSIPFEDLVRKLTSAQGSAGPKANATETDAVRFHDDKSQYTGVYKKGGPTNLDLGTSDLRFITNRAPADVRGVQS
eukprot:TRINITY_DN677_c0_g1_i1.p1 TRINITY_DN677_c0_g1~~TRINITY_DN677_c0_g1_i1.p1  ORF type:complete len:555 (+),score=108.11 TRINITY_DN677_c0_g1_i1:52-1716(+)